jgi:hypothetical protein
MVGGWRMTVVDFVNFEYYVLIMIRDWYASLISTTR